MSSRGTVSLAHTEGQLTRTPLSIASGKNLTRDLFVKHLREAIQAAGIDPTGFSGHSFRSGAATTAANLGVSDAHIKMMGRWKSNAYQRYIKTGGPHLAGLAARLSSEGPGLQRSLT